MGSLRGNDVLPAEVVPAQARGQGADDSDKAAEHSGQGVAQASFQGRLADVLRLGQAGPGRCSAKEHRGQKDRGDPRPNRLFLFDHG